MSRIIPGVMLGAFIGFACIWLVEAVSGALYPLPQGFDPYTAANQGVALRYSVPFGAQLLVVCGWLLGATVGGGAAAYFSRRRIGSWVVAALIVASALATAQSIARPGWMIAAGLILPWGCALAVQNLARWKRDLY